MQKHAIPIGYLILPILLPLWQCILFKETVCTNNQGRSCSFKTYTSLNANNGVTHMHVTTYTISRTNLFHLANGSNRVVIAFTINSLKFTLFKGKLKLFCSLLSYLFQISRLWQALCRIKNLTTTNAGAPYAYVVWILEFGKVCLKTMSVKVVNFLLTAKVTIAR